MGGWKLKGAESMKCMSFRAKGQAADAAQASPGTEQESPEKEQGTISCVLGMHKRTSLSYINLEPWHALHGNIMMTISVHNHAHSSC